MATRRNARYSPLSTSPDDDVDENGGGPGLNRAEEEQEGEDLRFAYDPKSLDRVPWRSIALALFLLSLGSLLLILSIFIFTGHMPGDRSQAYSLMALGVLSFLPGFYESRIAYYSWRGAPGYRDTELICRTSIFVKKLEYIFDGSFEKYLLKHLRYRASNARHASAIREN